MKKKILIYARKMEKSGGVEKNIYSTIQSLDKSKYSIIVIIPSTLKDNYYIPKLRAEGCSVIQIESHKNFLKHVSELIQIFRTNKQSILHIHVSDGYHAIVGLFGKIFGRMKVIFHSHNASNVTSFKKRIATPIFYIIGDFFLAVSNEAAAYMFGQKILYKNNYKLQKNGINIEKFKYKNEYRKNIRDEYLISENKIVLGFIGRLEQEKNVYFLIDIMKRLETERYELIIIGTGSELENISKKITENKLNNIKLIGFKEQVYPYLEAMDILLLPSYYESLGIVLIEAQTNGLKVLASKGVPQESKISPYIDYLDLNLETWIQEIEKKTFNYNRIEGLNYAEKSGYNLQDSVKELEKIYDNIN